MKNRASVVSGIRLSQRDADILDALVHHVRVLSIPQVARTWWPETGEREAYRRLSALQAAGFVHIYRTVCHPEIPLPAPAASWEPSQPPPKFGSLSYRLKARWRLSPTPLHCVIASKQCGRSKGGSGGRYPRESEQVHDVHMAAVFLSYRRLDLAPYWISEAQILRSRNGSKKEKLPDAIVELPQGRKVVEFGGAYSKGKLEAFHDYCEAQELPYEVW